MSYQTRMRPPPKKKGPSPFLRGLGFLIVVGFLSGGYLAAGWFFEANARNGWIYIPAEFTGPAFAPLLFAKVVFALLSVVVGLMLVTIAYGIIDPVRPGELDAPPPRPSRKKSR